MREKASASGNSVTLKIFPNKKCFQIHEYSWSNTRFSILKTTAVFSHSFYVEFGWKIEIMNSMEIQIYPKDVLSWWDGTLSPYQLSFLNNWRATDPFQSEHCFPNGPLCQYLHGNNSKLPSVVLEAPVLAG